MYKLKSGILLVVTLCLFTSVAIGQASKSPFTSRGIGDINDMGLIHNKGMGGVGVSNGTPWNINNLNPALLPYNSLTIFTAGFLGEYREISNETTSETNSGGNLSYLVISLPIKPGKWTSSLGLMPYSNVDYTNSYYSSVANTSDSVRALTTSTGSGGFNQLYWSNGVALNKNFSVGLKITYLFSSIERELNNTIEGFSDGVSYTPNLLTRTSVSDFMFSGGVAFRKDSIFNNRIRFNAGITYDLKANVKAKRYIATEQLVGNQAAIADTLSYERGEIVLPQALTAGFSFTNGYKWTAGVDVKLQQWSDFRNFSGSDDGMKNSYRVAVGGEFTPDYASVNSYLKRVTYRLGLSYENTPYVLPNPETGEQVTDLGINFGWSLPVGRLSSLDFAFKVGKRGSISDNTIEEDYYQVTLGFNFNDQWFIKRKYD
ncbi:hypothetical protein LVD15_09685 [Fulvivirga maritima]|uniref:hypothetical protein n=1 Tax=Fulvivirga maritima TaxID=2904247 RepID=UPI001F466660|nr:hypothetical protein [Fulvivirga maritima]UII28674.1 hypothetical protein LVD15_09685 [Fulvivirga maritima]